MSNKKWIKFNLNSYIKVKLTDKGIDVLVKESNELAKLANTIKPKTRKDFYKKRDKDGYIEFQGWCFIESFGHLTSLSDSHLYYSIEILIEK